eukprot:2152099-Pyramimonas_sp.AAC.1
MEDAREDRKAIVIYLGKTCKRRAYPAWGLPSEMTLLIEKPLEHIKDPKGASERVAAALSRRQNEEDEEVPQTNKGRALLMKMGWVPGSALGANPHREAAEAVLPDYWIFRRHFRAGLGTEVMSCKAELF